MAPKKTSTPVSASRRPSASASRRASSSAMRKGSAGGSMHTAIPVASDSDSDSDSDQSFYSAIDIRSPSPRPVQPPPRRRTLQERLAAERAIAAERAKKKRQVIDLTSRSDTSDASEDSDPEEGLQFYGTGRIPSLTGPSRNVAVAPVRHSAHAGPSNAHPGYIYTRDGFTLGGRDVRASSEMTDDPGLLFPHSMLSFEMPSAPMLDVPVLEFAGGLVPEDQDVIVEDPQAEFEAFISSLPEGMVSLRSDALDNDVADEAMQVAATAAAVMEHATAANPSHEAKVKSMASSSMALSSMTPSVGLDAGPTESLVDDRREESTSYGILAESSISQAIRTTQKRPRPPTPPLPSDDEESEARLVIPLSLRNRPLTPPLPEDEMDIEETAESASLHDASSQHSRSPSPRSLTPQVPARRSRPATPPGTPPPLSSPLPAKRRRPMTPEGTPPPLEEEAPDTPMTEAVKENIMTAVSSSLEKTPSASIATRTRSSDSAKKTVPAKSKSRKRKAKKPAASSARQLHPLPARPARGATPADDLDATPRKSSPKKPVKGTCSLVLLSSDAKRLKAELTSRAAGPRSPSETSPPLPELADEDNASKVARLAAVFRPPIVSAPSLLSRLSTTHAPVSGTSSRSPHSPPSHPTTRRSDERPQQRADASPSQPRLLSRMSSAATKRPKEDEPVVEDRHTSPHRPLSERIGASSSRAALTKSTRSHGQSNARPARQPEKKPSLAERLHASRTSAYIPRSGSTSAIEPTDAPPSPPLTAASSNDSAASSDRGCATYERIHGETGIKVEAGREDREQCSDRKKGKGKAQVASGGLRDRLGRGLNAQSGRDVSPAEVPVGAAVSLADRLARR